MFLKWQGERRPQKVYFYKVGWWGDDNVLFVVYLHSRYKRFITQLITIPVNKSSRLLRLLAWSTFPCLTLMILILHGLVLSRRQKDLKLWMIDKVILSVILKYVIYMQMKIIDTSSFKIIISYKSFQYIDDICW